MTKITYIHAVPSDEIKDRSALIGPANYLPYTQLTEGEMKLALLSEQARMLASAYPEERYLRDAVSMLNNALYSGIHAGVRFDKVVDGRLYDVAKTIEIAKGQRRPAAGDIIGTRNIYNGVAGIGADIVPQTTEDCEDYATRKANAFYKVDRKKFWWKALPFGGQKGRWKNYKEECETKKEVERILNSAITGSSHHVVYKSLNVLRPVLRNTFVRTKNLLHLAGVEALGNAADVKKTLMDQWIETATMRANAALGFGPVDSVLTSLSLAPNAVAAAYFDANGGNSGKWDKVGVVVATITAVTALVAAIGAAIGSASQMQKELNAKKNGVMNAAQGFGTDAYRAEQTDFDGDTNVSPTGGNKLLLLGGAAALAWALKK